MHELKHSYSDGIEYKKIAIFGIYPPPFGGVSVHVQRVAHKLQAQHNQILFFTTEVWWRNKLFFLYLCKVAGWLWWYKPDYVIYHSIYLSNSLLEMELLQWLKNFLSYEIIFVEHDCRHLYQRETPFKDRYTNVLATIDHLVLIGSRTHISYQENYMHLSTYTVESAFLPPDIRQERAIVETYPIALFSFLKRHWPVMVINAYQLVLLDGKDLYGIDLMLQATEQLRSRPAGYPSIGLIIVLGQIGNEHYLKTVQSFINEKNLKDHIYIMSGQKQLWPLFKRVTLFVRPTLSDGASVSVEEAHYCGIPVVASDICWRPAQTILFKTGNKEDLIAKLHEALRKTHDADQQRDHMHSQSQ